MPAGPLRHAEGPLAVVGGAMASGGDLGAFTLRPASRARGGRGHLPRPPLSHPYQSEPASTKALRRCVSGTGSSLLRFPQARFGLELGGETAAGRSPGEGAP